MRIYKFFLYKNLFFFLFFFLLISGCVNVDYTNINDKINDNNSINQEKINQDLNSIENTLENDYIKNNNIENYKENSEINTDMSKNELLSKSKIKDISGKKIELDSGVTLTFEDNIEEFFSETNNLREELSNNSVNLTIEDFFEDFQDRVRIQKKTIYQVSNKTKIFKEIPKIPKSDIKTNLSYSNDPYFIGKIVDQYLSDCKGDYFCNLTKEEILLELKNKEGEYEVTEVIEINKINTFSDFKIVLNASNIMQPPEKVNVVDFKSNLKKVLVDNINNESNNISIQFEKINNDMIYVGPIYKKQNFLNGFTYGLDYGYNYEKKWKKFKKEVASIKIFNYIGYGIGIRIPTEAEVTLSKAVALSEDTSLNAKIKLKTLDLDKKGYQDLGFNDHILFDGKEFVFKFGAVSGVNVKLLGVSVLNEQVGGLVDESKNFKPPLGNEKVTFANIVIPGRVTGLYYGAENVYVESNIGVDFNLVGNKLTINCVNNATIGCPEKLIFKEDSEKNISLLINSTKYPYEDSNGKYNTYGIILKNFKYYPRANFDFKLAIEAGLDTGEYILDWVTIKTPWIPIYSLTIDFGSLSLDSHPGTLDTMSVLNNKVYLSSNIHNQTIFLPLLNLNVTDNKSNELEINDINIVNLNLTMVNTTQDNTQDNTQNNTILNNTSIVTNISIKPIKPISLI